MQRGEDGAGRRESGPIAYRATPAFDIARDWKVTALEAEVGVEAVTGGGRRFMAAWRKDEVDTARYLQEKRETSRLGSCYRTGKHIIL